MKGIKDITWEEAKSSLKMLISKLYSEFKYLLDNLDEFDLPHFKKYLLADIDFANLKNVLEFSTRVLYEKHKKEIILLIDEYDSPIISAYEYNYYDEAVNFFKIFYGEALKTNDYLKMGIITGIIRVIKAVIFSEINISLEKLFNGEKIEEVITGNSDLSSLLSYHEIWELLLFSGYLTVDKKITKNTYSLRK